MVAGWEALTVPDEPIEDALREVGAPLCSPSTRPSPPLRLPLR